jgi:group II intron reverse transcriptase/maturase
VDSRRQEPPAATAAGDEALEARPSLEASPKPTEAQPSRTLTQGHVRRKFKHHSLIDKVYNWANLYQAWRKVRSNKGAHGLDRVTIRGFEADWEIHLREIQRQLKERRFEPQPVRRVYIPKASNPSVLRPLGIPVVADRVVQQAILQVLDPLFDHEMSPRSFGFRKKRKAHDALATAIRDAKEGFVHVVDADIASFFDRLDHEVVMSRVRSRIADGRILDLIEAFLTAGVFEAGVVSIPEEGSPQGGVISPWLANLVLDDLDKVFETRGLRHVRYADDFIVLCRSEQDAKDALTLAKEALEELKLSLHEKKTRLASFSEGFEFLGFRFRRYRVGIRTKAIDQFREKVRHLTRRQQGRNVDAVLADLNPVLRGFANYFGVAEVSGLFLRVDKWIRTRIRGFKTKRRNTGDRHRLPKKKLAKWGLLSLLDDCRPNKRLTYVRARTPLRAGSGSLQ